MTTGSSPAREPSASRSPRTCRTSSWCWCRSVAAGLASGVALAIKALRPGCAGHRRRARARRRCPRLARPRRDRPLAGRRRVADHRRRHPHPGPRAADVRPSASPPRRHRHRDRGGDRGRGPPRGGALPPRGRAVRRPGRGGHRVPCRRARAGRSARTGRRRRQRRQRGPGAVPRPTSRRRSRPERRAARRAPGRAARRAGPRGPGSQPAPRRPGGPCVAYPAPRPASSRRRSR